MTTGDDTTQYTLTPAEEADILDERRETRRFKYWVAKLFSITLVVVILGAMIMFIYDTIVHNKSIETAFIEKLINSILDFIKFIISS